MYLSVWFVVDVLLNDEFVFFAFFSLHSPFVVVFRDRFEMLLEFQEQNLCLILYVPNLMVSLEFFSLRAFNFVLTEKKGNFKHKQQFVVVIYQSHRVIFFVVCLFDFLVAYFVLKFFSSRVCSIIVTQSFVHANECDMHTFLFMCMCGQHFCSLLFYCYSLSTFWGNSYQCVHA
jgi:hypothetical protein